MHTTILTQEQTVDGNDIVIETYYVTEDGDRVTVSSSTHVVYEYNTEIDTGSSEYSPPLY